MKYFSKTVLKKLLTVAVIFIMGWVFALLFLTEFSCETLGSVNNSRQEKIVAGMWAEQEIDLSTTCKISVQVIPVFERADDASGIWLTVSNDETEITKFFPFSQYQSGVSTQLTIRSLNLLGMDGAARLRVSCDSGDADAYVLLFVSADEAEQIYMQDGSVLSESCFFVEWGSFQKMKLFSFFVIISALLFVFVYVTLPLAARMLRERKVKTLLLLFLLSVFISYAVITLRDEILTGSSTKEFDVAEGTVIEQEIELKNTKQVSVYYHVTTEQVPADAVIVFRLTQGELVSEQIVTVGEKEPYLSLQAHLDTSAFQNGTATLTVTGENLEGAVFRLFKATSANDFGTLLYNMRINGAEEEGVHLYIRYGYFNPVSALFVFVWIFAAVYFFYSCVAAVSGVAKENPALVLGVALFAVGALSGTFFTSFNLPWSNVLYLLSYKYGFIGKALPGTVLHVLSRIVTGNNYISLENLQYILRWILIFLAVLVLGWIYKMQKEFPAEKEAQRSKAVQALLLLYAASPVFVVFYTQSDFIGRADIILSICFLLCCSCIVAERLLWLIPLLTAAAVLSHQLFVFTQLPVLLLLMFYEWRCGHKKSFAMPLAATLTVNAALAVYIQYFSQIRYSYDEFIENMNGRSDANLALSLIVGENYLSTQEATDYYTATFLNQGIRFNWCTTLLAYAPLLYVLYRIWRGAVTASETRLEKLCFLGLALCPFLEVYSWSASVHDQQRYIVLCFMATFFGLFVLLRKKNKSVLQGVEAAYTYLSSKMGSLWPAYFLIYLAYVGFMGAWGALGITGRLKEIAALLLDAVKY